MTFLDPEAILFFLILFEGYMEIVDRHVCIELNYLHCVSTT